MEDIVRVLIADDNKTLVDFMKSYISKDNRYEVVGICSDVDTEIEMIDRLKPDIVITDIRKNNKWVGIDVVKEYKEKEYSPIFYVVSASVVSYIPDFRDLGIRYYISKPFEEEDFMRILNYAYNEIYPKEIIITQKEVIETSNNIINFFKSLKKRIGV